MTNIRLKTNSHLFLITEEPKVHKFIREECRSKSLREFFESIVRLCVENYDETIEGLIEEIPFKSKLKTIKGRKNVFYITLSEESYVPWELIMLINREVPEMYFAYDEETDTSSCLVYDPQHKVYPMEGYYIAVEGCGRAFHSFIENVYELDEVFKANYNARICTNQSVEEAVEDIRGLLKYCSIKLLPIQRI